MKFKMRLSTFSITLLPTLAVFFMVSCSGGSNGTALVHNTDSTQVDSVEIPIVTTTNATGSYSAGSQDGEEGGGYLAIKILDDDSLEFELDLNGGAPNYPTGTITGKMAMADNIATFVMSDFDDTETEGADECKITFTFSGKEVIVKQVTGTEFICGLGTGVYPNGTYTKQSDEAIFKYEGGK
jgi:hypothetical protein